MHLEQLHLNTAIPDDLRQFYSDKLKLPIVDQRFSSFTLTIGSTDLRFSQAAGETEPFYHFAVNIPRNQFAAAKEWLADRVELLKGVDGDDEFTFEFMNAQAVYFLDPAGNIVELIARHGLDSDSQQPFSTDSFLEVSEIGLPVHEVLSAARVLEDKLGIEYYSGHTADAEPSSQFTCLGNDHGLLVLVPIDRPWYPTEADEARAYPTEVVLTNDQATQYDAPQLPYRISTITATE